MFLHTTGHPIPAPRLAPTFDSICATGCHLALAAFSLEFEPLNDRLRGVPTAAMPRPCPRKEIGILSTNTWSTCKQNKSSSIMGIMTPTNMPNMRWHMKINENHMKLCGKWCSMYMKRLAKNWLCHSNKVLIQYDVGGWPRCRASSFTLQVHLPIKKCKKRKCECHAKSLTTIRLSEWHSHNVFSTRIQNYPFDRVIHGLHHSCSRAVCWMNLGASEQNAKYGKNKRVYKHSVYIIHYNTLLSVNLHNSTCQKATIHALSPRTMKDEKSVILQPIKQCDVWTKIGLYIALLTI